MARSACAFCQRYVTFSGEHVWSKWADQGTSKGYIYTRTDTRTGAVTQWEGKSLNLKAKVVCADCNSGWMSNLESRVKPILERMMAGEERMSINPEEIVAIAGYGFTKAVVADQAQSDRRPFFSPAIRRTFATTLEIPSGIQMWMARFTSRIYKSRGFNRPIYYDFPPIKRLQLYVHTYTVGSVVLQIAAFKWLKNHKCGFSQSFTQGFSQSFTHPRVFLLTFYQLPSFLAIPQHFASWKGGASAPHRRTAAAARTAVKDAERGTSGAPRSGLDP